MALAFKLPFQIVLLALALIVTFGAVGAGAESTVEIEKATFIAEVDQTTGNYTIRLDSSAKVSITAGTAAKVDERWISSTDYPQHQAVASSFTDEFGTGNEGSDSAGPSVLHTYTHAGDFRVHLVVEGIQNVPFEASYTIPVRGEIEKHFRPDRNRRFSPEQ